MESVESVWDSLPGWNTWERGRAGTFAIKGPFNGFCGLKVATVRPVPRRPSARVCLPDVSGIDDFQVLGQTEVSIQVGWKNPAAQVDYFRLTATDASGQEEALNVQSSQEARTKHTIVGQLCNAPNLHPQDRKHRRGATALFNIAVVQTAFHFCFSLKCIFFAGLFPGTDYQISVQAIKGAVEGKSSSVTGGTGRYPPAPLWATLWWNRYFY